MRLLDVRHEQTATFAAEATGKLTRRPGLAVLTAGPGRDQRDQRDRAGAVRRVADGRGRRPRPAEPLGQRVAAGARPAADHRADRQAGPHHPDGRRGGRRDARGVHRRRVVAPRAGVRRRADGRVLQPGHGRRAGRRPVAGRGPRPRRDRGRRRDAGRRRAAGAHPRHRRLGRRRRAGRPRPGRERRPARDHQRHGPRRGARAATPCSSPRPAARPSTAPTSSSWPARRSTSGSATAFSAARTAPRRPGSCTSPTRPARSRSTPSSRGRRTATSPPCSPASATASTRPPQRWRKPDWSAWVGDLQAGVRAAAERDAELLGAEADPIHPARIYGELVPRLADDSVVIGDGGDFVSFAGKYVEPKRPGGWLDPGPYGCLGAGLGVGDRRPDRAAVGAGRAAARRRGGRVLADGRRHARPPRPARRDGDGQQLRVGPGEGPDADALRLRRGRRPGAPRLATTRSSRRSAAPARP